MNAISKLANKDVSRRQFVVASATVAGGMSVAFTFSGEAQAAPAASAPKEVNAWVVVNPDDQIIIRVFYSEMGQGSLTGLAQLVAEELGADWSKVTFELPDPDENLRRNKVWKADDTFGSLAIRTAQQYVREGGAAAREMLIAAAAKQWNVPATECSAANSVITHKGSNRTVTFGKVAALAATMKAPEKIALKDPSTWTIAGKRLARLDTKDKVLGKPVYGTDVSLPGMMSADIKACPVFGGKLVSFDAKAVEKMPGVKKVVQVDDHTVAVVADTWWRAHSALLALPITWDFGANVGVSSETIAAKMKANLDSNDGVADNQAGDIQAAIKGAAKTITAEYSYGFQHHATMEPMTATAVWTPEKCDVWTSTQCGTAALNVAAAAAGLPVEKCSLHRTMVGGGFGRRGSFQDFVTQAVSIAKQMPGTPVKLIWSREEDMTQGKYHPATHAKMTAAFDANGNPTGFKMRISGQSIVAAVYPGMMQKGKDPLMFSGLTPKSPDAEFGYTFDNVLIDQVIYNPPIPPGFMRGVNINQNGVYLESFIEEMAHAVKQDPLEFRRKLLKNHPKHIRVLDAAAKAIGWETKPAASVGRGLAVMMDCGAYVAAAAEVSEVDGKLKVHRIVCAVDPGNVANAEQVARQVEGAFVMSLSSVLYGEQRVKGGRMERDNFHTYNVMRINGMPKVETIVMPSGGEEWGGVGEPSMAVGAPAVLNAYFAATGKRIRQLPLASHPLSNAGTV